MNPQSSADEHEPALRDGSAVTSSPLLRHLNAEQLAAVTLPPQPALILAGAGSGKTRVLTTRIAWLISTGQVSPGGVMAVTFTNKAAKEMLTRLSAMLPIPVRGMWVGTFHGLCNRFLRTHWKLAALPQSFQILDSADQASAVKRVIKAMNLDEERYVPKQVAWFIAGAKEDGLRPKDVELHDEHTRKLVQIYQTYEDQCQREGTVDFGELMLRTYELLRDNAPLREHYQRRFRHILVDEFQDTNKLQYLWLKMFAGPGCGLFVVGDDDQSIYAFRGAQVGNMATFEREFEVDRIIKLEQNYRSHSNILDTANALISRNTRRLGKNLRTDAGAGEPVRVHEATSDFGEAQWFIDEAQQLHRDGTPRHEISVLYRSNAQSRVIESALFNAAIPYRVYGGLRFFERAEVKHALAYLRLIENPNDDTSFLRVVNFPTRGIGARTIEQLQDAARASKRSLMQSVGSVTGKGGSQPGRVRRADRCDARCNARAHAARDHRARGAGERPGGLLPHRKGRAGPHREPGRARQRGRGLRHAGGLRQGRGRVAARRAGRHDRRRTAAGAAVDSPDAETGEILSPLAAFLTHAALEAGDNQAQAGQDAIQLMTVHSAKGLEFDACSSPGSRRVCSRTRTRCPTSTGSKKSGA